MGFEIKEDNLLGISSNEKEEGRSRVEQGGKLNCDGSFTKPQKPMGS